MFEGLLPGKHNSHLLDLLFILAHWHALAKLRQHTDLSLSILESVTVQLGESLRKFKTDVCTAYVTKELKREEEARKRRAAKKVTVETNRGPESGIGKAAASESGAGVDVISNGAASLSSSAGKGPHIATSKAKSTGKLHKTLNLNTYKDHALGDYVETIRRFGTTDSYSTESVSQIHFMYMYNPVATDHFKSDGIGAPFPKVAIP